MNRTGALSSVRVIDFSRLAPGPYCSMLLADMGANVIRVERPGEQQPMGDILGRGKRSIVLDLKRPDAADAALRLIERSDVLLEGFRPGVMERLGLGPDVCLERRPELVYARLTGWGQDGPLAQRAGHDLNYIALSGVLSLMGNRIPLNLVGDFAGGGLSCAFGIVCALLERISSGRGQVVDCAMTEGAAHLASFFAADADPLPLDGTAPFYRVYETSDHRWVSVGAIEPQFYSQLCATIGVDSGAQWDRAAWPERAERFALIFATQTREAWTAKFETVDACVAPVLDPDETADDPHLRARNAFYTDERGVTQPAPTPRLSRTPGGSPTLPPAAGQHTASVLAEFGFSEDEIAALLDQ